VVLELELPAEAETPQHVTPPWVAASRALRRVKRLRQSHAAVASGPLWGGVFSHRAGPILGALTETLVDSRDRSGQLLREELPDSCRGADWDDAAIGLGVRHTARGATGGVASLPDWRLRMIWTEHLIAEGIRAAQRFVGRDRTGGDDLLVELALKARERLARGAGEANAAITLTVVDRRWYATALVGRSRTSVDR